MDKLHSQPPNDTPPSLAHGSGEEKSQPAQEKNELVTPGTSGSPMELADADSVQKFVREEAKRIPDIRQERVDRIRAALKTGEYPVYSDLLADRIIEDTLLNESSPQD